MNLVVLSGYVTADPKVTVKNDGSVSFASFSIGIEDKYKNPNTGEETTDFANWTAYGKTAEIVQKFIKQGMKVYCTGSFKNNSNKEYRDYFVLSKVDFNCNGKKESQQAQAQPVQQTPVQQMPVQQMPVQQAPVQQAQPTPAPQPVQQAPVQQAPQPVQQMPSTEAVSSAIDEMAADLPW